uniref:Glycosyltransferase n=1 Tax=Araucaria cunninghamii TaxID=56994 RepID=A0A0D6R051_ARACU
MAITYLAIVKNVQITFSPILLSPEKIPPNPPHSSVHDLKLSLSKTANPSKTVIITTLNGAWAQNNSMVDLFLQSFHIGNGTEPLLNNLLIVAVDEKALNRCQEIHPHCYMMKTDGVDFSSEKVFMTEDYLKMMWRRLRFFGQILEQGYNFVFSDADIMWFRDPFTMFSRKADIQIASDYYRGEPEDLHNSPNGGFMYVRSNKKTVHFFRFWYRSRKVYPGKNEQDVLNKLKFKEFKRRGLKVRFLDTKYFGGYCQRSQDLNLVHTMHANCCKGLKAKLIDLNNTLSDWEKYIRQEKLGKGKAVHWTSPQACRHSWGR